MDPTVVGIVGLLIMIYFLLTGMNIGLAFLVVGFTGYGLLANWNAAISVLGTTFYSTAATYSFSVIPLFILMGQFALHSGLSQGLYDVGNRFLSWVPGGLAAATIAACAGFGAICGSLAATSATMGSIAIPEMRKHGYTPSLATGCVAAGGTLGILIPPSTTFIMYGICANASIGQLFASGILPGIILTVLMIVTIALYAKLRPGSVPESSTYTWKERFLSLKGVWGVVLLFCFVFGGMFGGVFTVNEAAAAGAFLAGVFMILRRKCSMAVIKIIVSETVKAFSMVYLILMGAQVMNNFLAVTKLPKNIATFVAELGVNGYVILSVIILIYLFLGCIMDGLAVILLTVPIFLPIVLNLGFDVIWFGTIIVLTSQVGGITPPVGISVYVIGGIAKDIPLATIFKGVTPFIISIIFVIALIVIFPQIAIWLPGLLYA